MRVFVVDGNDMTLTRGDTLITLVSIFKDGEPYILDAADVIEFSMRRKQKLPDNDGYPKKVVISKTIPNDTLLLRVDAGETKVLKTGDYIYNVRLIKDGMVDTFIEGELTLTAEA